ncbi:exodeoxyribonuclease V subunit alpha [Klebsiella pneumoniae]|nr:exodeoxyribonuclease V subunit alpha [Klebsiella pneumoniae]
MTFEQLLLAAVEQRLLRPLDVQFALMVAQKRPAGGQAGGGLAEPGCRRGARLSAALAVERRRGAER